MVARPRRAHGPLASCTRRLAGVAPGLVALLVSGCVAVAVGVFACAGLVSRYVADDFCTASILAERGFVGAQVTWYMVWSGRFAFFAVIDVLDGLGAWTVPLTPAGLLLGWIVASAAAVRPFVPQARHALLLTMVLVTATLATTPQLWQSLYWQTGAVTYLLPIVLATAYVGVVWRLRRAWACGRATWVWTVVGVVLVVVAVGCSETALAALDAGLGLALLGVLGWYRAADRRIVLRTLAMGLSAGLLASLIVALAPGNVVRATFFHAPDLAVRVIGPLVFPIYVLAQVVVQAPAYAVLGYAVPFGVGLSAQWSSGPLQRSAARRLRRLLIAGALLVSAAAVFPSFYLGGAAPPARAQVIPQAVVVAALMACGFLDGRARVAAPAWLTRPSWHRWLIGAAVVGLLVFGPLLTVARTIVLGGEMRAYAGQVDRLDQQARQAHAAGQARAVVQRVHGPPSLLLDELGPDPSVVLNRCAASYYGLDAIVATD